MAVAAIGAAGALAGSSMPALAATASGVRYNQALSLGLLGGAGTECGTIIMSAAASAGSPAYVSAMVTNTLTITCTGWLQKSVNGGAWTDVSPLRTPPSFPSPRCTGPVSLAASRAAPAKDGTSVYYAHNHQTANLGPPLCSAYLSSNSTAKTATSTVNMVLHGQQATCSGWLESSADNGTTWRQVTPTYSVLPNNEWAFAPAVADGTGLLARACVQSATQSACTTAW